MKCITVKQPWAELIVCGIKDVENRTWSTNHHGPLLIHASKQYDVAGEHWLRTTLADIIHPRNPLSLIKPKRHQIEAAINHAYSAPRGVILGVVELIICSKDCGAPWYERGMIGWVLRSPEKFADPIPFKGQLGLFDVPDALVRSHVDKFMTKDAIRQAARWSAEGRK